jgi:hypothetical protein
MSVVLVSQLADVCRFKGFFSHITACKHKSRSSFVNVMTGLRKGRMGFDSRQGEESFIYRCIEMLWGPLNLVSSGNREIFPQVKVTEAWWLSIQTSCMHRSSLRPIFVCSSKIIVAEMLLICNMYV